MNVDLIKKWEPILTMAKINERDFLKVAKYAQFLILEESPRYSILSGVGVGESARGTINPEKEKSLLLLSLHIISKIKDLSKVTFLEAPAKKINGKIIETPTSEYSYKLTPGMLELPRDTLVDELNGLIAKNMSDSFNEKIDEGYHLYFYLVCEIKILTEGASSPKLITRSRVKYEKE